MIYEALIGFSFQDIITNTHFLSGKDVLNVSLISNYARKMLTSFIATNISFEYYIFHFSIFPHFLPDSQHILYVSLSWVLLLYHPNWLSHLVSHSEKRWWLSRHSALQYALLNLFLQIPVTSQSALKLLVNLNTSLCHHASLTLHFYTAPIDIGTTCSWVMIRR